MEQVFFRLHVRLIRVLSPVLRPPIRVALERFILLNAILSAGVLWWLHTTYVNAPVGRGHNCLYEALRANNVMDSLADYDVIKIHISNDWVKQLAELSEYARIRGGLHRFGGRVSSKKIGASSRDPNTCDNLDTCNKRESAYGAGTSSSNNAPVGSNNSTGTTDSELPILFDQYVSSMGLHIDDSQHSAPRADPKESRGRGGGKARFFSVAERLLSSPIGAISDASSSSGGGGGGESGSGSEGSQSTENSNGNGNGNGIPSVASEKTKSTSSGISAPDNGNADSGANDAEESDNAGARLAGRLLELFGSQRVYLFSLEKGYLMLRPDQRNRHNIRSLDFTIETDSKCFGPPTAKWLVHTFTGYDTIVMNWAISTFGSHGYLYNVYSKELFNLNFAADVSGPASASQSSSPTASASSGSSEAESPSSASSSSASQPTMKSVGNQIDMASAYRSQREAEWAALGYTNCIPRHWDGQRNSDRQDEEGLNFGEKVMRAFNGIKEKFQQMGRSDHSSDGGKKEDRYRYCDETAMETMEQATVVHKLASWLKSRIYGFSFAAVQRFLAFKMGVVFTTVFLFFTTTTLVSFTLRETQERMLKFTFLLQYHIANHIPYAHLIFTHVVETLVFVPIMVGIMFFLFEFFSDQLLAFMVQAVVWLSEVFSVMSLRSANSIRFFPRAFFCYFALFHIYFFSFPFGFSYLALFTTVLFIQHSMFFCWSSFEIPAIESGAISAMTPRVGMSITLADGNNNANNSENMPMQGLAPVAASVAGASLPLGMGPIGASIGAVPSIYNLSPLRAPMYGRLSSGSNDSADAPRGRSDNGSSGSGNSVRRDVTPAAAAAGAMTSSGIRFNMTSPNRGPRMSPLPVSAVAATDRGRAVSNPPAAGPPLTPPGRRASVDSGQLGTRNGRAISVLADGLSQSSHGAEDYYNRHVELSRRIQQEQMSAMLGVGVGRNLTSAGTGAGAGAASSSSGHTSTTSGSTPHTPHTPNVLYSSSTPPFIPSPRPPERAGEHANADTSAEVNIDIDGVVVETVGSIRVPVPDSAGALRPSVSGELANSDSVAGSSSGNAQNKRGTTSPFSAVVSAGKAAFGWIMTQLGDGDGDDLGAGGSDYGMDSSDDGDETRRRPSRLRHFDSESSFDRHIDSGSGSDPSLRTSRHAPRSPRAIAAPQSMTRGSPPALSVVTNNTNTGSRNVGQPANIGLVVPHLAGAYQSGSERYSSDELNSGAVSPATPIQTLSRYGHRELLAFSSDFDMSAELLSARTRSAERKKKELSNEDGVDNAEHADVAGASAGVSEDIAAATRSSRTDSGSYPVASAVEVATRPNGNGKVVKATANAGSGPGSRSGSGYFLGHSNSDSEGNLLNSISAGAGAGSGTSSGSGVGTGHLKSENSADVSASVSTPTAIGIADIASEISPPRRLSDVGDDQHTQHNMQINTITQAQMQLDQALATSTSASASASASTPPVKVGAGSGSTEKSKQSPVLMFPVLAGSPSTTARAVTAAELAAVSASAMTASGVTNSNCSSSDSSSSGNRSGDRNLTGRRTPSINDFGYHRSRFSVFGSDFDG